MDGAWKVAASAAMERYARGDEVVFAELYDLLAPRLLSFLLRRARDPARADDLLQQTFLQMHCARRHFSEGACVVPWAFAIARRLLIDDFRRRGRDVLDDSESREDRGDWASPAPEALPDRLVGQRRLVRRVEEALDGIPEPQRTAFELVHRDGLSMTEAAEVLGTTVNAVKHRAFRAYQALREALGDDILEELDGTSPRHASRDPGVAAVRRRQPLDRRPG